MILHPSLFTNVKNDTAGITTEFENDYVTLRTSSRSIVYIRLCICTHRIPFLDLESFSVLLPSILQIAAISATPSANLNDSFWEKKKKIESKKSSMWLRSSQPSKLSYWLHTNSQWTFKKADVERFDSNNY